MKNRQETGTDFHIVTRWKNYDHTIAQIGRAVGRPRHVITDEALLAFRNACTSGYIDVTSNDIFFGTYGRGVFYDIKQRVEVLDDSPTTNNSYGLIAPSYMNHLQRLPNSPDTDTEHDALLLGALSTDTVREFTATTRTIFPKAACTVVDLSTHNLGSVSTDIADIIQSDATDLPFASGSFDSVHTDHLFTYNAEHNRWNGKEHLLFTEANRVLASGGLFVTGEHAKYTGEVLLRMEQSGFTDIRAEAARSFTYRRDMDRFFMSTAPEPLSGTTIIQPLTTVISGRKQ